LRIRYSFNFVNAGVGASTFYIMLG
jgi:hypothetical protein